MVAERDGDIGADEFFDPVVVPVEPSELPLSRLSRHVAKIADGVPYPLATARTERRSGGRGSVSDSDTFLSVEDLAARWQRATSVVYGLRYRGECPPAIRIGRELRFRLSDIEAWEEGRRDNGGPRAA